MHRALLMADTDTVRTPLGAAPVDSGADLGIDNFQHAKADAERMGLAIDKVPSPIQLRSDLEAMMATPVDRLRSFGTRMVSRRQNHWTFFAQGHRAARIR